MAEQKQSNNGNKNEVPVEPIKWASVTGFHSKQQSETQADSMGTYQQAVSLILSGEDGKERSIPVQAQGKPAEVNGKPSLPTSQRQMIKLLVALWNTFGSIKGSGYTSTFLINFDGHKQWMEKLAANGTLLEFAYGNPDSKNSPDPVVVSFKSALTVASAAAEALQTTIKRYPPTAPKAVAGIVKEPEREEVAVVL